MLKSKPIIFYILLTSQLIYTSSPKYTLDSGIYVGFSECLYGDFDNDKPQKTNKFNTPPLITHDKMAIKFREYAQANPTTLAACAYVDLKKHLANPQEYKIANPYTVLYLRKLGLFIDETGNVYSPYP